MATILVVDDNATNRALLSRILEQDGHRVVEAVNGAEALGLVRMELPDLVLTDVLMPKVDGYALERQLRADPLTADLPVIFHTAAYTPREVRDVAGNSVRNWILPKPSEFSAIRETVSTALSSRDLRAVEPTDSVPGEHEHLAVLNAKLLQTVRELEVAGRERQHLLAQIVRAQEEERERIAADIHDDPIQVMTAVAMRLEMIARSLDDPQLRDRVAKLLDTARQAISRLRWFMFELHPPSLERDGLLAAIEAYAEHVAEEAAYRTKVLDELQSEPPVELRVLLYRMVQEAMANAAKHADASTVEVTLSEREGGYHVAVRDDGRGFDHRQLSESARGHLGLTSIGQRSRLVGGWCRFDSTPGAGTLIEVWVPATAMSEPAG